MSDDFDKEAEREKLREQFEAEQQRREATQQMSELLLKGATMTNKHCDTCGDPVFRHEGQEFCANCRTTAGDGDAAADADRTATATQRAPDRDEGATTGDEVDPRRAQSQAGTRDPQDNRTTAATDDGVSEVPVEAESRDEPAGGRVRRQDDTGGEPAPPADRHEHAPRRASGREQPRSQPAETVDTEGLEAAAALQRALEKFSREAAAADDPREAKQHLAAAREAAEALAVLRR